MTCVAGPRQTVPRRAADMVFEKVGASPGQATQVSAQKGAIKKIKALKKQSYTGNSLIGTGGA